MVVVITKYAGMDLVLECSVSRKRRAVSALTFWASHNLKSVRSDLITDLRLPTLGHHPLSEHLLTVTYSPPTTIILTVCSIQRKAVHRTSRLCSSCQVLEARKNFSTATRGFLVQNVSWQTGRQTCLNSPFLRHYSKFDLM